MQFLRQSTATIVKLGPFLDSIDGVTAETALTISQADVRLSKNGGNMAQKNESSSCTHDENGYYDCNLDVTDTGTPGRLLLSVSESGALPVWHEFMVVPANVYDSLFGSDRLQVDVRELGDSTLALTMQMKADVNTEADTALTDYDPPTKAELDSGLAALNDPTAAAIRTEIDNNSTQLAAIVADTNELQTDWANGGRLDLLIDAILADTNELQSDDVPGLIAALNDPTAQAVVDELMAEILESGKTYKQAMIDLWAVIVGDSSANDADTPTSITYDSPDGTVQRTHALTSISRSVS